MNDDFRVRQFKNNIIEMMNGELLPLEVKRLVLADILNETTKAADESIRNDLRNSIKEKSDSENSPE